MLLIVILAICTLCFAQPVVAGSADDSDSTSPEVGAEWVEDYPVEPDLTQCNESVAGLTNNLMSHGWTRKYFFGNEGAWEEDFAKASVGGTDYLYADAVDLVAFSGHGCTDGFEFSVDHDYQFMVALRASWGDGDLEWIFLDSCSSNNNEGYYYWFTNAFNGLHLLCGWNGDCADFDNCNHVDDMLIDDGWWDVAYTVRTSWLEGAHYHQPWNSTAVTGETSACGNDYIWKQGSVVADPTHDSTCTRWTHFG
jgi:hypothetical protein